MLFARNIAHSFPLKPSTTPLRSAEICRPHTQEGLGFTKGKKCLGFARRERRRERFFGVDDRSSRGIRIISRELDRRSIERDVKGKRERERERHTHCLSFLDCVFFLQKFLRFWVLFFSSFSLSFSLASGLLRSKKIERVI